jgi:hypothetical protein
MGRIYALINAMSKAGHASTSIAQRTVDHIERALDRA